MRRRIVLFGATGYTGSLVAEELVLANARPVLAGRNYQNLAALGVKLGKGLDTRVADVRRPDSLLELIEPGDVVVNMVGPFLRYGRPVVEAAIHRRAFYIDACGEPGFIRTVFEEYGPVALQAGVTLLPAFAYEYVAGNLAAALVLTSFEGVPSRVEVGYFLHGPARGAVSPGTRASAAAAAFVRHHAWRDGAVRTVMPGDRVRTFPIAGRERPGLAIGGAEHFAVPRLFPEIREVGVYAGGPNSKVGARLKRLVLAGATRVPGFARVGWLAPLPPTSEGPDAEARERTSAEVIARAYDATGRELRTVRLGGANPYTFTAAIAAWAALRLSGGAITPAGALGPVEAFGLNPLRVAAAEAGLPVVDGAGGLENAEVPASRREPKDVHHGK